MQALSVSVSRKDVHGGMHGFFHQPLYHHGDLLIRPIHGFHERVATDLLVRRMYAWRGYRVNPHMAPQRDMDKVVLAAWRANVLAATMTLSSDHGNGLISEVLYPEEIRCLRTRSENICEYTRFAVDPEHTSGDLHEALFRSAYNFAKKHFGATDAVVEVNPRHSRFFQRSMGFTRLGELRVCPRVDAPAILLHRDLRQAFFLRR